MCLFTNKLFLRHSKSKISWFEKSISNDDKKKKTFHVYLFWSENKKKEKRKILQIQFHVEFYWLFEKCVNF